MTQPHPATANERPEPGPAFDRRANWVRIQTVARLRWIAVAGQVVAVLVGQWAFGLKLEFGPIFATIGAAVITNLMAILVYTANKRLSETELVATLIFDMVQLTILLALTGGLHNPFALLILAQVAISATALRRRSTIVVCTIAVALITGLRFVQLPLVTETGEVLQMPEAFVTGFWCAIVVGIVFQAAYARRVTSEVTAMADALSATQMALAREQKLTDLGGVVAAAAHELGTPLATIAVVSAELVEEAEADDQRADAQLIRDQAERCREILRSMGRAGKQDRQVRISPIRSLVEEAAEPHRDRGIEIVIDLAPLAGSDARPPSVERRPELIHGLRNLVQNAVDFAASRVWIDIGWSEEHIYVQICDDGPGYPADILPRLGDPFLRNRRDTAAAGKRQGYEGMGLGLFIAKTLLERSGADVTFANGRDAAGRAAGRCERYGALVTLIWPRAAIATVDDRAPLGENAFTT